MSVPEEETQEVGVEAAGGAGDGGQEGDPVVVGVAWYFLTFFWAASRTVRLRSCGEQSWPFLEGSPVAPQQIHELAGRNGR